MILKSVWHHAKSVYLDEVFSNKNMMIIAMVMMMVINEGGGTMRTSSILVKSLTKTFTRTKVAEPVAFAPGGLYNKTQ